MDMNIGVIKGDGIGPEIVDEAMKVLDKTAEVYGHQIEYTQCLLRKKHWNRRKKVMPY